MAGITLEIAQARLDAYLAAELAVLGGQKYEIAGRMLQRADLAEIRAGIGLWDQRVKTLDSRASGGRRAITPRPGY
jgi:Family of unknown function (DUF6148)